ncbi:DUF5067 domain-containing protein [Miniphocaeibacter massiliensis]|uniref:DUF5067 domain-containing protein n=1 Tax=Miniphocaeibacter massiliensis TaxID=2041841 RepID=UPI000C1C1B51|nr:DUF5067 domain-containing protein [Miniphocaeibacter massiliensis]
MKKKVLILCLAIVMLFTACGGKDKTKETEGIKETEVNASEDEEIVAYFKKLNDEINADEESLIIFSYDSSTKTEIVKEKDNVDVPLTEKLKNSIVGMSEAYMSEIGKGYKVEYRNKKDEVLLQVLDGKITKETKTKETSNKSENTELVTNDYKFEFKDFEVLDSKFGDGKKMLVITLNYTNNSSEPQDPWTALVYSAVAEQETDISVESLNGGNSYIPDSYKPEAVDLWMTKIKPNTTVEVVLSFELVNTNPVKIMDRTTKGSKFIKEVAVQ